MSQVAVELGRASNATVNLNEAAVRVLFGKPTGAISMSDGYGKTYTDFGTGADGAVTISSHTTLTANKNYTNLTVNSGIILNTAGYTIKCTGTILNYGTIYNASTPAGGAGGAGAAATTSTGNAGGAGVDGTGTGGKGGGGGGSGGGEPSLAYSNAGGSGGAGGQGGGSITINAYSFDNRGTIQVNGYAGSNGASGGAGVAYSASDGKNTYYGCTGGSGGGAGGSGGDGGVIYIRYKVLLNTGTVTATGGAGGSGGAGGGITQYNQTGNGYYGGAGNSTYAQGGGGGRASYSGVYAIAGTNGASGASGLTGTVSLLQS
jgi:hypothetical protein